MSLQIRLNEKEITERIITTFIEMLIARKVITEDDKEKVFDDLMRSGSEDMVFKVTIKPSKTTYVLKRINHKISAISKDSGLTDFLKSYEKSKKFIVPKDIVQKVSNHLNAQPDTEVFKEEDMMFNILKHDSQPEFDPIDPTDKKKMDELKNHIKSKAKDALINEYKNDVEKFKKEYRVTAKLVTRMDEYDPVAKFLGLKPGRIIRVIRPSEVSSKAASYRIVCPTSMTR